MDHNGKMAEVIFKFPGAYACSAMFKHSNDKKYQVTTFLMKHK